MDENPGSSLDDPQHALCDRIIKTNFETTNTVVPGLTMYVRSNGSCHENRDASGTIARSIQRSELSWKLENMNSVVRNGKLVAATALYIGSTIVAWSYGDTTQSSRKNISWKDVMASLQKTQPVVCIDSEPLSNSALKKRRKLVNKYANKYARFREKRAMLQERKRKLYASLNQDLDYIHTGTEPDEDKEPPSLLDTQPALCGMDENPGSSLDDTQPALCGMDEKPGSSLNDTRTVICGLENQPNFELTNTVVPGLTMYVRYNDPSSPSDDDAIGTICRSTKLCKIYGWGLKNMDLVVRNGKVRHATAFFIGRTIVAWGYSGHRQQESRKNISWKDALASLLKTQPVVFIGSKQLPKYRKKCKHILCRNSCGQNGKRKKGMSQGRKREIPAFPNHNLHDIHKGNEVYIVRSAWVDKDGGLESMVDNEETIRKYMERSVGDNFSSF